MFDKNAFLHWWTPANLSGIGLSSLSIDAAQVRVQAFRKSLHWVFCEGLMLGNKTAHLTITPGKKNDTFEYFHLTLDQPEVKHKEGVQIRCDHVFFETDEVGDVKVVSNLYDADGKSVKASSKPGLTHNEDFLKDKVLRDIDRIMGRAAYILMPQHWT